GDQTAVNTWTSQCTENTAADRTITTTGNIISKGNISSASITSSGAISGGTITSTGYLAITATAGRPTTPSAMGCYLGRDQNNWAALELCSVTAAYVDFTTAGTDMKGRFMYSFSTSQFDLYIAISSNMTLNTACLYLGATLVSASDKRLKFNEKPLINALDVINKLEPVEYDQTF
ncbi:MAG: hypothetical protein ACKPKO_39180, partial [Candidatus Fonsibacter sp.]